MREEKRDPILYIVAILILVMGVAIASNITSRIKAIEIEWNDFKNNSLVIEVRPGGLHYD